MAESGKIKVLEETPAADLRAFRRKFPNAGPGESHVVLAYMKTAGAGQAAYCILDDRGARAHAAKNGVEHTGLIGLRWILKRRKISTALEIDEIVEALRSTRFRLPKSFRV